MQQLRIISFTAMVLVASAFVATTPALAQSTSGGLFGATRSDTAPGHRLNFLAALTEAIDSEIPPELQPELPQGSLVSGGLSTMVLGSADYSYNRSRAQVAATGQTAFRYYERLNRLDAVSHSAGMGANIQLARKASFEINQSFAYSPSYFYQFFPATTEPELGETIPTAPDFEVVQADSYMSRSGLTLAMEATRRTQLSVSGGYDRTRFGEDLMLQIGRPKVDSYNAAARVARDIRRNAELSVEYGYRTGDFGLGVSHEHRVTVGAQYSRALSRSRRAVFRVQVTPSTLDVPASTLDVPASTLDVPASTLELPESTLEPGGAGRVFRMQGGASVEYPFRRTWVASATMERGVEYLALLGEPVMSHSGRASLEGLLTRRLEFLATASYANGASVLGELTQLDTQTANVRLRFALTRGVAVYSEYVFFSYNLLGRESLAPTLPPRFNQHGFRVGAMLWGAPF